MRPHHSLLVLFLMVLAACTPASPTLAQPQAGLSVTPSAAAPSATALPTATATPTLAPTDTPMPATATPTIDVQSATRTMLAATEGPLMQGLSSSLLSQCPNPSDPPQSIWVDIPVMPQATAGQVVQKLIGSYYCFRAPVTVEQMENFYKDKLPPPDWVLQSSANGSMVFASLSQAGAQLLFLVSGPGNKNDLIVAINVTKSLLLPTPTL